MIVIGSHLHFQIRKTFFLFLEESYTKNCHELKPQVCDTFFTLFFQIQNKQVGVCALKLTTTPSFRFRVFEQQLKNANIIFLNSFFLGSISPTFFTRVFCTNVFFSSYVLLCMYKKCVQKTLVKLTPDRIEAQKASKK